MTSINVNTIESSSNIVNFINSLQIFITGGTGFLGSVFIEKILRTCPGVQQIYLLIRSKKKIDVNERFEKFLQKSIFNKLKEMQPNFDKKITLISGDITLTNLGLEQNDLELLIENVNCIINCAANVQFNEPLRIAAYTNVLSIIEILKLAKKIKNLKNFLHVSTAFTYCHLNKINEEFYDPPILAEKLLNIVANSNDAELETQTPKLIGNFPNTYVFTKAIAEDYLKRKAKGLPIVVIRPGIITGSHKEPSAGWIDTANGPAAIFIASSLGILRCLPINEKVYAELVPVDYVANCGIALLAAVETKTDHDEIKIYNFVSSPTQFITWDFYYSTCKEHYMTFPSVKNLWNMNFKMIDSLFYYQIYSFFFNTIRGIFLDTIIYFVGQKPFVLKTCTKIEKVALSIKPILLNSIVFTNKNVTKMWSTLNEADRKLFEFDMQNFDWNSYLYNYVKAVRVHLLKDPMKTVDAGRKKYKRLETIDMILKQIFGLIIVLLLGYILYYF